MLDSRHRQGQTAGTRVPRKLQLRLAVALPFVTGLLALGVGVYGFQAGRTDATSRLSPREAARIWSAAPDSWWWLAGMSLLGLIIGLAIAMAFTRQLRTLTKQTEVLARRDFSMPLQLDTDGEVTPLVGAINDLLATVHDYARHSAEDGVILLAADGRVLSINPRAAVTLGVETENVLGRSYEALAPDIEDNREVREALIAALEGHQPFDLEGLTWVNTRGQRLRVDLRGTILAGASPIVSVLVGFDHAPDIEAMQRQVSRAHRLLVIGGFASELAHEIRNPLSSICGLVDLLHERLPEGDEGHAHLSVLMRAAGRIERLVSQLLDLVPTEIHDLERCDIGALVTEAVQFVRFGEPDDALIELVEHHEPGLPRCYADPDRISRAVENLLRNAYAHTPAGGRIVVSTSAGGAGGLEIEIENTGSYVCPEDRERIFQPFVSGRPQGTGLGLAIAQQIAYAHGGTIDVESVEDSHTTFILRLPAVDEPAQTAGYSPPRAAPMAAGASLGA